MSDAGAPKRIKLEDLPEGAIRDVATLLEWGRQRGYQIGPVVEHGGLRLQVRDLRQAKIEGFMGGPVDDMPDDFKAVAGGGEEP